MSSTTLLRGAGGATRTRQSGVIFISTEEMSRDMLISYINFMRNHVALKPLEMSKKHDQKAKRRAEAITHNQLGIKINHDRSPYSVVKHNASMWIQSAQNEYLKKYRIITTESLSDSDEFLNCILSNRCASVGICICDENDTQCPLLVQVFDFKDSH